MWPSVACQSALGHQNGECHLLISELLISPCTGPQWARVLVLIALLVEGRLRRWDLVGWYRDLRLGWLVGQMRLGWLVGQLKLGWLVKGTETWLVGRATRCWSCCMTTSTGASTSTGLQQTRRRYAAAVPLASDNNPLYTQVSSSSMASSLNYFIRSRILIPCLTHSILPCGTSWMLIFEWLHCLEQILVDHLSHMALVKVLCSVLSLQPFLGGMQPWAL